MRTLLHNFKYIVSMKVVFKLFVLSWLQGRLKTFGPKLYKLLQKFACRRRYIRFFAKVVAKRLCLFCSRILYRFIATISTGFQQLFAHIVIIFRTKAKAISRAIGNSR